MRTNRLARALALSLMAAIAGHAVAQPATTAFTYQGRLTAGGVAQSTNYDLQFKLFDAAVGGSQLGGTIALSPVLVSGGLFTVNLDFGQQFNSTRRWLEISVHLTGAGGGFTTLAPRQELTAAPHAEGLVLPIAGSTASSNALNITSTGGTGVRGNSGNGVGDAGVWGISTAANGNGVLATADNGGSAFAVWATAAQGYGVVASGGAGGGSFSTTDGIGLFGAHYSNAGTAAGVEGDSASTSSSAIAVLGHITSTAPGGFSAAVRGQNDGTGGSGIGVYGSQAGSGWGVYATSVSGYGVYGIGSPGVVGQPSGSGTTGVQGNSGLGGGGSYGVYGISTAAAGNGVRGECSNGAGSYGVWGVSSTGYAGFFSGNVNVAGTLSKSGGAFKIDHPLDPANKYLWHSFVESPDMMNIYNGNVRLDGAGTATVSMPDWFEVLNTEFRYQLTAIGAPGPNLYVAQTMKDRQFVIAGGTPGAEVSWQVTGVRHDAWANAHRIPTEEAKRPEERGLYIHPELYGMPASASIDSLKGNPPAVPTNPQGGAPAPAPVPAPALLVKEGR